MLGTDYAPKIVSARLTKPLKTNGARQDYIRTRIIERNGTREAEPFAMQDSSMQKIFAESDGLIVRPPQASAAAVGDAVAVMLLDGC
jgi:molybdopterin molybdotransferase